MKILWIPQISSKSKDGKILLSKDSNMAVLMNMRCSKFFHDNDITVALEFSRDNCIGIEELQCAGIRVVSDDTRMFSNAKLERFNFNVGFYEDLQNESFDIVFVNEPTKVQPLKEIFCNSKVVTYNHWMACKNMKNLMLRQFEGMKYADACFLNSNYAMYELLDFYKSFEGVEDINFVKLQPSFAGEVKGLKQKPKYNIIYNHRLSSDEYYAKAFDSLVEVCNIVEKQIKEMPTIYFTNPSGKDSSILNIKPYFKELKLDNQKEYKRFISSEEIGIHLNTFFDSEGMWSMSTVDCAVAGNICLLPNKYGYAEIFNKDYAGYCDTETQMAHKLIDILNMNIDKGYEDVSSLEGHRGLSIGNKLQNILSNLGNDCKRPWGEYDVIKKNKYAVEKVIYIKPNEELSLQRHKYKNEMWEIVKGQGRITIGDFVLTNAGIGDKIKIDKGTVHDVKAYDAGMIILEHATSDVMVAECDIERIGDKYGRV